MILAFLAVILGLVLLILSSRMLVWGAPSSAREGSQVDADLGHVLGDLQAAAGLVNGERELLHDPIFKLQSLWQLGFDDQRY